MRRTPIIHTLRSDGTYTTAALLAADTGAMPTFARNCTAYRDYWDGATRKLAEVAANIPRWVTRKDTGGVARSGLLVEAERTNIQLYSHSIENWNKDELTLTGSQAFSVDGTNSACIIDDKTTMGSKAMYQGKADLGTGAFCYSIFVKAGTIPYLLMTNFKTGPVVLNKATIKFSDMTVTASTGTAGIENWGADWYLVWWSANLIQSNCYFGLCASLDGTSIYYEGANRTCLVAAAQVLLATAYPSGRIVTTTAPATCLKDAVSYDVTGRIGQRGSLVFDIMFPAHDFPANAVPVSLHDGSADNRITCSILATGDKASATVVSGGDTQADITDATTDVVDGDKHTIAISWEPNSIKLYVDGTLEGTADTEATIPSGITTLTLGDHAGANQCGAMISDLKIYNRPGVTS